MNLVLDKARQPLEDCFEQLKNHNNLFGFLGFKNKAKQELKRHAADLEIALTYSKITQMDRSINTVKQEVGKTVGFANYFTRFFRAKT